MYETADKVISALDKWLIRNFGQLKNLAPFDTLNRLQPKVDDLFKRLRNEVRKLYLAEAKRTYKDTAKKSARQLDEEWLDDYILESYDTVSKVVFLHELDRRRAMLIEAILASETPQEEIDAAAKRMSLLLRSYAIRVADEASLQALRDDGWKRVKWITRKDEYRCKVCTSRDGRVYSIDRVPPKPHFNCRCRYVGAL